MFALGREPKRTQTRGRDDAALLLTLARKETWFDIIHSSYVCQNAPPFSSDLCVRIRGSTADGPAGETASRGSPEHRNHRRHLYDQHVQHAHQETPNRYLVVHIICITFRVWTLKGDRHWRREGEMKR